MYHIAICDSSSNDGKELEGVIQELAEEAELPCTVEVFRSAKALNDAVAEKTYQMILLETVIGGTSGVELARRLRFRGTDAEILFVTKNPEYALVAYSVFPVGYVIKPASKRKLRDPFFHAAEKEGRAPTILLRTGDGGRTGVKVDDILYIEVFRTELDFHCRSGVYVCSGSLAGVLEALPTKQFYRSHRSYIVNLKYVTKLEKYAFSLITGDRVTVAKNRYAEAKEILREYTE